MQVSEQWHEDTPEQEGPNLPIQDGNRQPIRNGIQETNPNLPAQRAELHNSDLDNAGPSQQQHCMNNYAGAARAVCPNQNYNRPTMQNAQLRLRNRSGPPERLPTRIQVSFRVIGWPAMNDTFVYPVDEPLLRAFRDYAERVRYRCHCGLVFKPQGTNVIATEQTTLRGLHNQGLIDLTRRIVYFDVTNINERR